MIKKIAIVLLPVACVLTMGASLIAWFAVPSVYPTMQSLTDYSFEAQPGAVTTWTVTRRVGDGGQVTTGAKGFDAVVKAQNDLATRLKKETSDMRQLHDVATQQLELVKAQQEQDLQAVEQRAAELKTFASQYQQQILQRSADFQGLTVKSRVTRDEVTLRREDVTRLQSELEELRTDHFQLAELQRTLTDRLLRIQLDNQNLLSREQQLTRQLTEN